jgi:hypothetical protein
MGVLFREYVLSMCIKYAGSTSEQAAKVVPNEAAEYFV